MSSVIKENAEETSIVVFRSFRYNFLLFVSSTADAKLHSKIVYNDKRKHPSHCNRDTTGAGIKFSFDI